MRDIYSKIKMFAAQLWMTLMKPHEDPLLIMNEALLFKPTFIL